jgi:hypothetical protein
LMGAWNAVVQKLAQLRPFGNGALARD